MKFSSAIVAAVVASSAIVDVSAFGTSAFGVRSGPFARQPTQLAKAKYDLDLGDVDLSSPPPAPVAEKPKRGKKAAKVEEPKPVVEEPKPAKKARKVKAEAPKVVEEKPAPAKKSKKKVVEEPKIVDKVPEPKKKAAPKAPKAKAAPPAPKAVAPAATAKDPNAGPVGVALGVAPLIVAPVALLAGARGALSKTTARREAIQEEIAAEKARERARAAKEAQVDGGGVVGALTLLGGAVGAAGLAVTQSLAGSGMLGDGFSLPTPSLPSVSVSAPAKSSAPKAAASAPKSKIAFVKDPKGYSLDTEGGLTKIQQLRAKRPRQRSRRLTPRPRRRSRLPQPRRRG